MACPFKITRALADNGKACTDRLFAEDPEGAADQRHDGALKARSAEVPTTRHFSRAEGFKTTLHRYVWPYNHHLPQKALGHVTPIEAMNKWYAERPASFITKPHSRPGRDS